jgi:hypothetical protein
MVMNNAARLSCWAAVVGAAVEIIAILSAAIVAPGKLDPKTAQSVAYIVINILSAVGAVLVLYGLPGIFVRWRESWGRIGLAGIALLALMWMLLVFFALVAATLDSWLAVKAPDLFDDPAGPPLYGAVTIILFLALIVGSIMMAIPILRGRVGRRWVAFLLIASPVMFVAFFWAAVSPPNVPLALIGSVGPILACVALGYLGYLGASDSAPADQ